MNRLLAFFAFGGFIIALSFHIITYIFTIPTDIFGVVVVPLMCGIFPLAIPFSFMQLRYKMAWGKNSTKRILSSLPQNARIGLYVAMGYVLLNFFIGISTLKVTRRLDGDYLAYPTELGEIVYVSELEAREENLTGNWVTLEAVPAERIYYGSITGHKEINESDYDHYRTLDLRFFTGHLMIFYLMPSLTFFFLPFNPK